MAERFYRAFAGLDWASGFGPLILRTMTLLFRLLSGLFTACTSLSLAVMLGTGYGYAQSAIDFIPLEPGDSFRLKMADPLSRIDSGRVVQFVCQDWVVESGNRYVFDIRKAEIRPSAVPGQPPVRYTEGQRWQVEGPTCRVMMELVPGIRDTMPLFRVPQGGDTMAYYSDFFLIGDAHHSVTLRVLKDLTPEGKRRLTADLVVKYLTGEYPADVDDFYRRFRKMTVLRAERMVWVEDQGLVAYLVNDTNPTEEHGLWTDGLKFIRVE